MVTILGYSNRVLHQVNHKIPGSPMSVYVQTYKQGVTYILELGVKSCFSQEGRCVTHVELSRSNTGFRIQGETGFMEKQHIDLFMEEKLEEESIDNVIFQLTQKIQASLMQIDVEDYVQQLRNKGFFIAVIHEQNGDTLDFEIFSPNFPRRKLIYYMQGGEIQFEYLDDSSRNKIASLYNYEKVTLQLVGEWLCGERD